METVDYWKARALTAEAQLAELAKRKPVGSFHIYDGKVEGTTDYVRDGEWPIDEGELLVYARAAPPAPVKLPKAFTCNTSDYGNTYVMKASDVIQAIKAAGGSVADE